MTVEIMFDHIYYPHVISKEMLLVRISGQSIFELSFIFNEIIITKGTCNKSTLLPMIIAFRKGAVVIVW